MKKTIFTLAAIATLFLGACKKDNDNKPSGNDTYQPFSAGSVWKYRNTTFGENAGVDTSVNTMTAQTKTINGKTFHVLGSVTGDETIESYLGFNNNVYSTFADVALGEGVEIGYLNDSKNKGDSWTSDIEIEDEGETYTAKLKTTIIDKGINKTILDKAFSNVIHTKVEIQVQLDGEEWTTLSSMEFFVAKGVGVIAIYNKFGSEDVSKSELFSYTIK